MNLINQNITKLKELQALIALIEKPDYVSPDETLFGATVGQHIRHTLEFYICLANGTHTGAVCYDDRKRDIKIEENIDYAKSTIDEICFFVKDLDVLKNVNLKVNFGEESDGPQYVQTSIGRELVYLLDHMIHHMAIFKYSIVQKGYSLDENMGVAPSTIKYRETICVQSA